MRPKRLKTFDYIGSYHYCLTFCTYQRRRYFEDDALVDLIGAQLSRTSAERDFAVMAYCYMADHLHLLLAGLHGDASLLPCVEVMRQRSSRAAKIARGIHLWRDGYFEWILRSDEQLEAVARYIFENPVRAGLVDEARNWRRSGGRYWAAYSGCPS